MRISLLSLSVLFFAYINAADQKPIQETISYTYITITTIYGRNDGSVLAGYTADIIKTIKDSDIWEIRADWLFPVSDIKNIIYIARQFKQISRLELHCKNYKDISEMDKYIREQVGPRLLSIRYDIKL